MFIFYGTRSARIKKYTNQQYACTDCKTFDLEVRVWRDYYHMCFIPVIPTGEKEVKIHCKNCGEPIRLEALQHQFRQETKTPFYLFTLPLLVIATVAIFFLSEWKTTMDEQAYVLKPNVGDVYKILLPDHKFEAFYFARVLAIKNDSIVACSSKFQYLFEENEFGEDDYFIKENVFSLPIAQLKTMLDSAEIREVYRNYDTKNPFSHLR
ncbi:MAG: hypothetical protein RLY16_1216 [Bacteroidota bacterium]